MMFILFILEKNNEKGSVDPFGTSRDKKIIAPPHNGITFAFLSGLMHFMYFFIFRYSMIYLSG